jgi:VanZ family protein
LKHLTRDAFWRSELRWWPLWITGSLIGLALTAWFSLRSSGLLVPHWMSDKLQHAIGYLVLTLWFCGLVPRSRQWRTVLACVALGVLMEGLQGALTVNRVADPLDALANATGALIALVVARSGLASWAVWVEGWGKR